MGVDAPGYGLLISGINLSSVIDDSSQEPLWLLF